MEAQMTRGVSRGFEAGLRDGRRVRVRPITRADKPDLARGLARMSPRSRYLRFHRVIDRLSDAELRYLTEIDLRNHFAWAAFSLDEPGQPGVGVIRYVRDAVDRNTAEVAVTIVDDYQGVGLGRLLLETLLVSAMLNGIDRLQACVLPENTAAFRLFRSAGARPGRKDGDVLILDVPVSSPDRALVASAPHPALAAGGGLRREPATRATAPSRQDMPARTRNSKEVRP